MSGKLVGLVYERELGHAEQAVLVAMADHADDFGRNCFPSVPLIAWKTGYHERQVQRIIGGLRDIGALVLVLGATRYRPTEYRIDVAALPMKPPFKPEREDVGRGDICETAGVTFGVGRGDIDVSGVTFEASRGDIAMSPEPSYGTKDKDICGTSVADAPNIPPVRPEPAKPKRTSTAKPKPPPDPRVRELQRALEDWQGYSACNWAAEGVAAKLIIGAGYTIDDTRAVWRSMKAKDFWQDKHLSLASVYPQLGAKLGKAGRRRDVVELQPVRREVAS